MTPLDRFVERVTRSQWLGAALILGFSRLPLFDYLSGALLALIVLMRGYLAGLLAVAMAGGGLALLGWVSGIGPVAALVKPLGEPAFSIWLPALVLAVVLRSSRSLALMVVIGALLGCALVVGQLVLFAHPIEFWQHLLGQALGWLQHVEGLSDARWHKIITGEARLMPGISGAGVLVAGAGMVILARYFQSRILRPGAFGEEFRRLNLGRVVTVLASLIFVAQLFNPGLIVQNLAIVMLAMFLFQGLAVIHAVFRSRGWPRFGLALIYVFMMPFFTPLLSGLVSGLGLVDNWFDFRRQRGESPEH